ncbi:MAG: choice-of-anchor D domain-containing protein [Roseivirga sp.]|nr:choice-of-anchor D domain-containing protein [Roseivirga sp.]
MNRRPLILIALLALCQLSMAQRKTFTGDVNIFSFDDFETFTSEKYTHIEGNLTIIQSINNVSNHGHIFDEIPNGLNSLIEISGTFKVQLDANESTLDLKNLVRVGGDLDIRNLRYIKFRKLKEVNGNFLPRDIIFLKELSVPRLEFIGGDLDWSSAPEKIRFPRLTTIGGDMILEDDTRTTLIHMPRLTRVVGNVDIDGVTIPSDETLEELNLQQLRTVGGMMKIELPYSEIETPVFNNLEIVGGDFLVVGTIPEMPKLREVIGKLDIRSSGVNSNIDLNFPSLLTVSGDLIFQGLNNNPEALRSFSALKLEQVGGNISHETFLTQNAAIKEFKAPSLKLVTSISVRTNSFDLTGLEQINSVHIQDLSANGTADFNSLKSGQISLTTEDNNPLASIDAPVLESATGVPTNALELYFPNLRSGIESLEFSTPVTSGTFSSIENLESLSFNGANITSMDFSSLNTVNDLRINHVSTFAVHMPKLEEVNELNIEGATLSSLNLDATSITSVSVLESTVNNSLFRGLENVHDFFFVNSDVTSTLDLSGVRFANFVQVDFNTPAKVDLQNLASAAIFESNLKGLKFKDATEVDLSSLIQIDELSLGLPNSSASSVLETVHLNSLTRIKTLDIGSDVLQTLNIAKLQTVNSFKLRSESLGQISLAGLKTVKTLDIKGNQISSIGLASLGQLENLIVENTEIGTLNLGSVTEAKTIVLLDHPNLTEIDLGNLPQMMSLTLKDLPKLEDLRTTKPGEEGGLIADLTVENIMEETVELTCANGALLSKTFYPALRLITLMCEAFDNNGEPSSRAVVDEDIEYVTDRQGTGYTFTEEINFPTISVSLEELDFGLIAEEEISKSQDLTIANNGQAAAGINLDFQNNDQNAYTASASSFNLAPGASKVVTLTFTPSQIGQDNAFLEINSAGNSKTDVRLTGIKDGCIQIGDMCIKALTVSFDGDGKYRLSNQVVLADFLKFSGEVLVDTNEGSIKGNGLVFVDGIPSLGNLLLSGKVELYQGEFEFNLLEAGSQKLASSLEGGTNNLLRFANLPIRMGNLEFIDNGIQFSARMNLPPALNGTEVDIETIKITSTEGVALIGQITAPGNVKLGNAVVLKDLFFTFNTEEDEFGGGATLETKLFDITTDILMKKGGLDEVGVTIIPTKPIPVGTTGWSLTEGKGRLISLQNPPPTMSLSVDMQPTVIANFDLVKLNDLGLSYTFGRELAGSGELEVLDQSVARAKLRTTGNSIQFEGEVNFGDYIIGRAFMSADNASTGMRLRGAMNARVQIPNRDTFFHQVFDGAIGLPYTVASAETRFYNTVFSGETNILGFSVAYGLAYVDEEFHFDLAKSHHLLNQELFGNQGGTPNFSNSLTNRFEGRSLKYKPNRNTTNTGNSQSVDSSEQTEQTFNISRELNDIYIRVKHETAMPEYKVIMPDGTEINAENAGDMGVLFAESETETMQAFYAFKSPAQGEWKIMITSEDLEYAIDVAGADPEPTISFKALEKDGQNITIPWMLNNVDEHYKLHLLFDNNKEHFDGSEIISNLTFDTESYQWNIENLSTGEYYIYAELENTETGVVKAFYSDEPLLIVQSGAPSTPTGLMVSNNDIEIQASWGVATGAAEYSLYYEVDRTPDFNSRSFQTNSNSLTLAELTPGKNYFFAVSAWSDGDVQSQLSESVSLEFTSESLNNAPDFEKLEDKIITATVTFSQELSATDPENDVLTFRLVEFPEDMALSERTVSWTPTEEQLGQHTILAEVIDSFGNFDEMEFNLLVERPNSPPTDISLSNTVVTENNAPELVIGSLSTTDPDVTDEHSYTLVSGEGDTDNNRFSITGNQLIAAEIFDFENVTSLSIRVSTTDKAEQSFEKVITLSVENVNEAPVSLTISNMSISENLAIDTVIGTLTTDDPDTNDTFAYTLVSGDGDAGNASFALSGSSLVSAEVFDFETRDNYSIRVASEDAGGLTIEKVFMISISDGPDPMIRLGETSLTFEETALSLSQTLSFTIHNEGDAPLQIASIQSPEGFMVNQTSLVIAASSSGEVEVTFSPTEEKIYQGDIIVQSNAGSATLSVTGEGAIITSIDDPIPGPEDISIYPNPVQDQFTLDLKKLNGSLSAIGVYDSNGRPHLSISGNFHDELIINTHQWKKGIYLLRISTEHGSFTKKIIRQ